MTRECKFNFNVSQNHLKDFIENESTNSPKNVSASKTHTSVNPSSINIDEVSIKHMAGFLNNIAPKEMPIYNFNIDCVNGERYYKPDGTLLFTRYIKGDVIKDYYYKENFDNPNYTISQILERNRITGRLKVKVEPVLKYNELHRVNIIIFDSKINHKYAMLQLTNTGVVTSISEISNNGSAFKTIFRNQETGKPTRYIEGHDGQDGVFEIKDYVFNELMEIVQTRTYKNRTV